MTTSSHLLSVPGIFFDEFLRLPVPIYKRKEVFLELLKWDELLKYPRTPFCPGCIFLGAFIPPLSLLPAAKLCFCDSRSWTPLRSLASFVLIPSLLPTAKSLLSVPALIHVCRILSVCDCPSQCGPCSFCITQQSEKCRSSGPAQTCLNPCLHLNKIPRWCVCTWQCEDPGQQNRGTCWAPWSPGQPVSQGICSLLYRWGNRDSENTWLAHNRACEGPVWAPPPG